MKAKDRIVFPLDFESADRALEFVERLKDRVGLFKIGLTLYISQGPGIIRRVASAAGGRIFLDLKFHDIPETVAGVARAVRTVSDGVRFLTVHAAGGEAMMRAAVSALGKEAGVLGVTVLTSQGAESLTSQGIREPVETRVLTLARAARDAGCAGVVCSGSEARAVKKDLGAEFLVVTPGIRPEWAAVSGDDQKRVLTPGEAVRSGSDYVVVGRPISGAKDPAEAAGRVEREIEEALGHR
jgi:orotidine-5'-phosphate decarboxylase